jgi:hypothetical protein
LFEQLEQAFPEKLMLLKTIAAPAMMPIPPAIVKKLPATTMPGLRIDQSCFMIAARFLKIASRLCRSCSSKSGGGE